MNEIMQYEVALSFASEEREYVEKVAQALQGRGIEVFLRRIRAGFVMGS